MFALLLVPLIVLAVLIVLVKKLVALQRPKVKTIAFFHPFANAGGGGERVLWSAIIAIARALPQAQLFVYTGDTDVTDEELLANAQTKFALTLPQNLCFVRIYSRWLLEGQSFPRLTLLGQAIGSILVACESVLRLRPNVLIDTMGCAFSYPVFYAAGADVVAYVHYPFISQEMIAAVRERRNGVSNSKLVARNILLSKLKLAYYEALLFLYGLCGSLCSSVMVNSKWTLAHLKQAWRRRLPSIMSAGAASPKLSLVYPPCDLEQLSKLSIHGKRAPWIISLGQFRAEKNHELQIEAFSLFLKKFPGFKGTAKLFMLGGCRNHSDHHRVATLQAKISAAGLAEHVQIKVNIGFAELQQYLGKASIGLHTMSDEHFGINIVEFLAAGLIVIAHASGGPKLDIITSSDVGFLATAPLEYANAFEAILTLPFDEQRRTRERGRQYAIANFTFQQFTQQFIKSVVPIVGISK